MKKRKPEFEIYSYGRYSEWNRESKEIPKILEIGTELKVDIGTEFGYVLKIRKGKGETITFKIDHPPFKNEKGEIAPPFIGEAFIASNTYDFFLGDCIWEPLNDKLGKWELTTYYQGKKVAFKSFNLV